MKNEKGILVPAKIKINLSRIAESDSDIKKLMEKVDADVSRLPSDTVPSTFSTIGQVLQLTKNIMDKVSQVCHGLCPIHLYSKSVITVTRHTQHSMHRGPFCLAFTR